MAAYSKAQQRKREEAWPRGLSLLILELRGERLADSGKEEECIAPQRLQVLGINDELGLRLRITNKNWTLPENAPMVHD